MIDEDRLTDEEKIAYINTANRNSCVIKNLMNKTQVELNSNDLDQRLIAAWIINTLSISAQEILSEIIPSVTNSIN